MAPKAKKKPRSKGQPTKLTPEMHNAIVELVAAGNYGEVAAQACGIDETTYYNWMKWGEYEEREPYYHFFKDIKKAKAQAQTKAVEILTSLHTEEWQSLAWYLERTNHQRWGRKTDETTRKYKLECEELEKRMKKLEAEIAALEQAPANEPINVVVRNFDSSDEESDV